MRAWLINRWDSFRTGFWFIPAILISAALGLAIVIPEFDAHFQASMPDWFKTKSSTARSTLAALASAMFTVAGVVFSVTVVVLSVTSSQFGPRLLRNFLEESTTKVTMGAALASSIYCLILLWRIDDGNGSWFVPSLSVALATLMTLGAICTVVFFMHRVARSIQSMNVISDVATDLDAAVETLFPESIGEGLSRREIPKALLERFDVEPTTSVLAPADGYLQSISDDVLIARAKENAMIIKLDCKPGDFLIAGHEVARCLPAEHCDESVAAVIGKAFLTGDRRTPRQDVECAVSELVEVAVRALSPGINDPFTAVASVDRLCATFCRLARRDMANAARVDDEDTATPLVIAKPTRFPNVLNAGFDQIRQYGSSSVAVSIRLLESLEKIAHAAIRDEDHRAIMRQAEMIVERCRKQTFCAGDMEDIEGRFERVRESGKGKAESGNS